MVDFFFFLYIIESICETNIKKKKSTICSQHLRIMPRGRGRGRGRGKKGRGRGIKKGGIKKRCKTQKRKKERKTKRGRRTY